LYNAENDKGRILILKKEIKVILSASKESPQALNEDIVFTVKASGFFNPAYEFYLIEGNKKTIVQEKSTQNTWEWFPEKEGTFKIGVVVKDAKEKAEAEIEFKITTQTEEKKE
jgi:hypothetical protein